MRRIAQALTGGSGGMSGYSDPGYALYVREVKTMGGTPLTLEQWTRQQTANNAPIERQAQAEPEPAKPFRF